MGVNATAPVASTIASYETPELVAQTLALAGHDCIFPGGTIKMLPGQRLAVMADFHSPYDVNKHNYTFQAYTPDLDAAGAEVDATFNLIIHGAKLTCEIRTMLPDMTGWTKMEVDATLIEVI